jgi:hypothetical protein
VAVIVTAADKAVQPNVVVALAVYVPTTPSAPTTSVVLVAPGIATPSLYQMIGVPAGVTVAVSVAVWPGCRVVADAAILIVGCVFTVTVTLEQVVVLQVPSALTK